MIEQQIVQDDGIVNPSACQERSERETTLGYPRLIKSVLISTVTGVILYGAATLAGDYQAISQALMNFPLDTLALVLLLVVVGWLLRGWRFYYYLQSNGASVPLGYSISSFLAGFALTSTPGKLGEAVKGIFLKQDYGVSVTRVVGIVMMERLMDLAGVLLLASFSVLLFKGWEKLFLLCAALVIAGGAFLCMESLYRPVLEWLGRFSILRKISERVLGILETGRSLVTGRILAVGLVVSTVAWGMESVSLYLILQGFNLQSTLLQANFVYCISTLVGALSMLPGGIGGTEAGMIGLLKFMGITYTEGLPSVLLIRLCTLWFAIAVGVGFMVMMLTGSGRKKNR
ncbi:MAG: flippase-like domain-containing protein [Desulfomonile tiedjei]|uniref:Flippase-like domain-containing protein n=1 Tax=Desulfomonile tiedjei TaxID=2358 RepID=A0A9D6Z3X0_9BACT|nr:flippase-like domain-containing protein [Desulfomonile tiedjei]